MNAFSVISRRVRWVGSLALILGFQLASSPLGAEGTASTAEPVYELFVGLDVFVATEDGTGRVRRVHRGRAEVDANGGPVQVPLRRLAIKELHHTVKLNTTSVSIENVQAECVAANLNVNEDMFHDMAVQRIKEEEHRMHDRERLEAIYEDPGSRSELGMLEIQLMKMRINQEKLVEAARAVSTRTYLDTLVVSEDENPAQNTATLKARFSISASRPVADAYVAIFARLRNPVDPRATIHRVMFHEIRKLGPRPTTIRIEKDGVPPASMIELFEIHVYAGERELSANVAQGRAQVSRSEAIDFMRLQRLNLHPGETLPPEIMPSFLPAEAARLIAADQATRSVRVSLDAEGNVTAVALTSGDPRPTDASLEAMIQTLPFLPALDGGEPIASEMMLKLGDLLE